MNMKLLVITVLVLVSCGGGGGGSSSSVQPQPAPNNAQSASSGSASGSSTVSSSASISGSHRIALSRLVLSSNDNLAQLKLGQESSRIETKKNIKDFFNTKFIQIFENIFPNLIAQSLKPLDISQWDTISKKITGGSLTELNADVRVYEADDDGFIFRSTNKYICHYKIPSEGENSSSSASESISLTSSDQDAPTGKNPGNARVLYKLTDDDGNDIEVYEVDAEAPSYSQEALSCNLNEVTLNCDVSTLPINIKKAVQADDSGSFFAKIEYAYELEEFSNACTPKLETKNFLIKNSNIYPLGDREIIVLDGLNNFNSSSVLKPNGPFNSSNKIVAVDRPKDNNISRWQVTSYELGSENNIILTQISPPNLTINSNDLGKIAFDGTYIYLADTSASSSTFYTSKVDEEGFSIVRPSVIEHLFFPPKKNYSKSIEGTERSLDCSSSTATEPNSNDFCTWFYHHGEPLWLSSYASTQYKSFRENQNDVNFVFDENGSLIILSNRFAHRYDPSTQVMTKVIDTFPPPGLRSTINVSKFTNPKGFGGTYYNMLATDCPDEPSSSISMNPRIEGTTQIESCMVWPQATWSNIGFFGILGRWENYIILNSYGAWDPESMLNTGRIWDLPVRPRKESLTSVGVFFSHLDNYLFSVSYEKNIYTRYDLRDHSFIQINLDDFGYLAEAFEITKDFAYVEVINSNNSNKEYVKLSFIDGTSEFIGTISEGNRTVIEILPLNN